MRKIQVKKDSGKCKYRCTAKFIIEEQKSIFQELWMLTDNEKANFYSTRTEKNEKDRKRTKSENSRKKYSFKYFLIKDEIKTRV